MHVDAYGVLWLADPAMAAATIVVLTALLLWCHRMVASDAVAVPVPVRVDEAAPRRRNHDNARRRPLA